MRKQLTPGLIMVLLQKTGFEPVGPSLSKQYLTSGTGRTRTCILIWNCWSKPDLTLQGKYPVNDHALL